MWRRRRAVLPVGLRVGERERMVELVSVGVRLRVGRRRRRPAGQCALKLWNVVVNRRLLEEGRLRGACGATLRQKE